MVLYRITCGDHVHEYDNRTRVDVIRAAKALAKTLRVTAIVYVYDDKSQTWREDWSWTP